MSRFFMISLDPAQLYDYSALSVMECIPEKEGKIYRLVDVNASRSSLILDRPVGGACIQESQISIRGLSTPIFLIDVVGVGRRCMI